MGTVTISSKRRKKVILGVQPEKKKTAKGGGGEFSAEGIPSHMGRKILGEKEGQVEKVRWETTSGGVKDKLALEGK